MLATNRLRRLRPLGGGLGRGLDAVRTFERQARQMLDALAVRPAGGALQVWTSDEALHLRAELPGASREAIDVTVEDGVLELRAERPALELAEGERLIANERGVGAVHRRLRLPWRVDADRTEATYVDGVLQLVLHRAEDDKPRKIAIS